MLIFSGVEDAHLKKERLQSNKTTDQLMINNKELKRSVHNFTTIFYRISQQTKAPCRLVKT